MSLVHTRPTVGVLALQGGVAEHLRMIEGLGAAAVGIRRPEHLVGPDGLRVDALILPGGESSTLDRLLRMFELFTPLQCAIRAGIPTLGTCAGLILLATTIVDPAPGQQSLAVLDVTVGRNAFGAQLASREDGFAVDGLTGAGPDRRVLGALIRAPEVREVGAGVRVIARSEGRILGVTSADPDADRTLGAVTGVSFHPELTGDPALHRALLARVSAHAGR